MENGTPDRELGEKWSALRLSVEEILSGRQVASMPHGCTACLHAAAPAESGTRPSAGLLVRFLEDLSSAAQYNFLQRWTCSRSALASMAAASHAGLFST